MKPLVTSLSKPPVNKALSSPPSFPPSPPSSLPSLPPQTKKQYERASEDAENAQHKLEKADNDPNSTKAKIDQFTTTLRQKEQTAEECQNNYILTLDTTNDFRREHFNSKVPALFTVSGANYVCMCDDLYHTQPAFSPIWLAELITVMNPAP